MRSRRLMMEAMGRGQSRAHRGRRVGGLAPLGQRSRIRTGVIDAAAAARAARELEQIRGQVTGDIHRQIRAILDGRAPGAVLAEEPCADTDRESPPDLMVRLAFYAGAVGDTDLAMAYLSGARNGLYEHIQTLQDDNDSSWLRASAHAKARRAGAEWMIGQIEMFQRDQEAFAAAVSAEHVEASFGEQKRLIESLCVAAADAAASGRRRTLVACAAEIARLEGADDVAARVEAFDDERIGALGRVARAVHHHPQLLSGKMRGEGGLTAAVLDDIAGDGLAWRSARLGALGGREAEREYLRVHGHHYPRDFRESDGTLHRGTMRTAAGAFRAATHRVRIAAECDKPAFVAEALTDAAMTRELVDELVQLPGRVRHRALRIPIGPHEGDQLLYEVLYEGIAAEGDIPMALSFRLRLGRANAQSDAATLDHLNGLIPDGVPRAEYGMWEADDLDDAATPVAGIATLTPGDAPTVATDAFLGGAEAECAHQLAAWHDTGVYATLECRGCGDALMRRPQTSIDEILARGENARFAAAEWALPRVQALACLMGEEPPASEAELLAAPRCDNWVAELDRERSGEAATRRRPASIGEAMRRR